jgi:hypothetical protein
MLTGRPLLPGALLLDVASTLAGRRVGYRDLEDRLVPAGSRSQTHPDDPDRALGPLEHLVARLHTDPAPALPALVSHAVARRHLERTLAVGRIAAGERAPELRRWAGFVPPEVLPCPGLDAAPIALAHLAELIADPGRYFLRRVLGGWPASWLRTQLDPLARDSRRKAVLTAMREALSSEEGEVAALALQTLRDAKAEELERAGLAPAILERLLELAGEDVAPLQGQALLRGPLAEDQVPVVPEFPWQVHGFAGRVEAGQAEFVLPDVLTKAQLAKAMVLLLEVAARQTAGTPVQTIDTVGLEGRRFSGSADDFVPPAVATLGFATLRAALGWWPFAEDKRWTHRQDVIAADPAQFASWGRP